MTPTWDILICSIVHRTELLAELLDEFARQRSRHPTVGVHVYRDNLEVEYGPKCQALLDSSEADYVSWFDDDDWPADDFVRSICKALREDPDYVGFMVDWTEDGEPQVPVYHSLQNDGWHNGADCLTRDIVHFNPIRREIAARAGWYGGGGADCRWADQLRSVGAVETEVYIPREMYHYRKAGGSFQVPAPMLPEAIPPRPDADWVTWL